MNDDVLKRVLEFTHPHCENKWKRAEILLKLLVHVQAEVMRIYHNQNSEWFVNDPVGYIDLRIDQGLSINVLLNIENPPFGFRSEYSVSGYHEILNFAFTPRDFPSISEMFEFLRANVSDRVLDQLLDQLSHMVLVLIAVYTPRSEPRLQRVRIKQTKSSIITVPHPGLRPLQVTVEPILVSLKYGPGFGRAGDTRQISPASPALNWQFAITLFRNFIGDEPPNKTTTHTYVDRKTPKEFHDTITQLVRRFSPRFLHCLSEKTNPPALQRSLLPEHMRSPPMNSQVPRKKARA